MQKYINKDVKFVTNFGDKTRKVVGTLLSANLKYIVETNDQAMVLQDIWTIELPSLPEGFFTVATLNWKVFSKTAQTMEC